MCIEFKKLQSYYDFYSDKPEVLIENGLVTVSLAFAGVVTSVALKNLGYSGAAFAIANLSLIAVAIGSGVVAIGIGVATIKIYLIFAEMVRGFYKNW